MGHDRLEPWRTEVGCGWLSTSVPPVRVASQESLTAATPPSADRPIAESETTVPAALGGLDARCQYGIGYPSLRGDRRLGRGLIRVTFIDSLPRDVWRRHDGHGAVGVLDDRIRDTAQQQRAESAVAARAHQESGDPS